VQKNFTVAKRDDFCFIKRKINILFELLDKKMIVFHLVVE